MISCTHSSRERILIQQYKRRVDIMPAAAKVTGLKSEAVLRYIDACVLKLGQFQRQNLVFIAVDEPFKAVTDIQLIVFK